MDTPKSAPARNGDVAIPDGASWDSRHVLLYVIVAAIFVACLGLSLVVQDPPGLKEVLRDLAIAIGPVWMLGLIYQHFLFKEIRAASTEASAHALLVATKPLIEGIQESARQVQTEVENMMHLRELGIERAFRERKDAMLLVKEWLRAEKNEIAIVGTSLRGLFWEEVGDPEVVAIIRSKTKDRKRTLKFKIVLTHPAFSDLRERLERQHRPETFRISMEIRESVRRLLDMGLRHSEIHFVKATPTCFAIKTSSHMLINPYPLENQALASFCIVVGNHQGRNEIYRSFAEHHFIFGSASCVSLSGTSDSEIDMVFKQALQTLCAVDSLSQPGPSQPQNDQPPNAA